MGGYQLVSILHNRNFLIYLLQMKRY